MKHLTTLILTLFASNLLSEELSNVTDEETLNAIMALTPQGNIPSFVRGATAAGVGTFINVPSPTNPVVDIAVQQWWIINPNTNNVLRIYNLDDWGETDWMFPTNEPVVFFAYAASNVVINTCIGEGIVARMNQAEREQLMFPLADRSWFRVSRDNGLVYDFTTNFWHHTRVNPNMTNQYELLRDTYRDMTPEQSWRVMADAGAGLETLFYFSSESYLADKRNDPLLHEDSKNFLIGRLIDKYRWGWDANDVFSAPDTATLYIAASNFTAQALTVWRTHDTARIISFAQNAVSTNITPETLLFRGIVAYYLENDFNATTNLTHSAGLIVLENRAYTLEQKGLSLGLEDMFSQMNVHPIFVRNFGKMVGFEGQSLEDLLEWQYSESSVFAKFGGEFPFGNTFKILFKKE